MSTPQLIPFGKYKGQPIEVLAQDKSYTDWLLSQPSFKQRNPELVSIIINNFQEPSETPDHNALQVKFLSEEYRLKFAYAAMPEFLQSRLDNSIFNCIETEKRRILHEIEDNVGVDSYYINENVRKNRYDDAEQKFKEISILINTKEDELKSEMLNNKDSFSLSTINLILESNFGCDVEYLIHVNVNNNSPILKPVIRDIKFYNEDYSSYSKVAARHYMNDDDSFVSIEIKPSVGDDFPAVLRQMKLSGAKYLFLEKYTGIGATESEFVDYFKTQGVRVVFKRDVDAVEINK